MMVPEQVQPRLHGAKDIVDLLLPRVRPAPAGQRPKWPRRLMRQQNVDRSKGLAGVHFVTDEVAPLVCQRRGPCRAFHRMRQRGSRGLEPRWRECATETGNADPLDLDRRTGGNLM